MIAAEPELGDLVYGLRSLDEGFIPPIFDPAQIDRKFLVNAADSLRATRAAHRARGHLRGHLERRGDPRRRSGSRAGARRAATSSACCPTAGGSTCRPTPGTTTSSPPRRASRSRCGGSAVVDDRPIGVFDSGVGGLTVARADLGAAAERVRRLRRRRRAFPVRPASGRGDPPLRDGDRGPPRRRAA